MPSALERESWVRPRLPSLPDRRIAPDIKLRAAKAIFLRVVELLLEGLRLGVVSTKRDLYYRDVQLFGRQQIVDTVNFGISITDLEFVPALCRTGSDLTSCR